MPHMLDLYAGFGGQSEPFLRAGWEVLRIDNNVLLKDVEQMCIMDIHDLKPHWYADDKVDYIHASPPCLEFSNAFHAPRAQAARSGQLDEYEPNLEFLYEAIRIIGIIKPRYWSIENVQGSRRYFEPILGPPTLIVGSWVYWGKFPRFDPATIEIPTKASQDRRWSPLRANYRAYIPLCVAQAFLRAMEEQKRILEF